MQIQEMSMPALKAFSSKYNFKALRKAERDVLNLFSTGNRLCIFSRCKNFLLIQSMGLSIKYIKIYFTVLDPKF